MPRIILSILAALIMLGGCSASEDMELAQGEVAEFHQMLDSGRFAEIYAATAPDIRRDMNEAEWIDFLSSVHNGLGNVTKANATGWNVNYNTDGSTVELVYDTQFAKGAATETFVYRLADNKATLAGYQIKTK